MYDVHIGYHEFDFGVDFMFVLFIELQDLIHSEEISENSDRVVFIIGVIYFLEDFSKFEP